MKAILVLLLLLGNGVLKSQDQGIELPNHLGFFVYEQPKNRVIKHLEETTKNLQV